MNKLKNISKMSIIVILFQLIGSCNENSSEPQIVLYYTLNDVKVQNINNAGEFPVIIENENEIILKEAFGINIILNLELISNDDSVVSNNFMKNISLFSRLYAMSCDDFPPEKHSMQDTIIHIKVFSLNDFDDEFSANSDVSELFKVYVSPKYIPIYEYIEKYPIPNSTTYYQTKENKGHKIDLYLIKPPTFIGEHSFRVEILLSNDSIFSATTPKINLE